MKIKFIYFNKVRAVRLASVLAVIWVTIAASFGSVAMAQHQIPTQPYTLQELNKQLRQSVGRDTTEADLAVYIDRLGISFDPTPEAISRLRANGAHQHLINSIKRAAEKLSASYGKVTDIGTPAPDPYIEEVRTAVRDYLDELPDFICQQVIERYYDFEGRGAWDRADTLTYELTYNRKQETYKPINAVGRPVTRPLAEAGGTTSAGDFASMLSKLFDIQTRTIFRPAGKDRLGSRQTRVYDFRVPQESSTLQVKIGDFPPVTPGYSGTIWIDEETKRVLKLDQAVEALPKGYPDIIFENSIDYDIVKLRGLDVDFLLPIRAEVVSSERRQKKYYRNLIYFKFYRKFETDVKLTDDTTPVQKP